MCITTTTNFSATFTSRYVSFLADTMPAAKRSRVTSSTWAKARSGFSKLARKNPKSDLPKIYKFARTVSSNGSGTQLVFGTDALGVQKFFVGSNNSSNLQVDFSLQQMRVLLGGVTQITSVMPDYADFTGLFDQYRIDKVEVRLIPAYADGGITTTSQSWLPTIVHAIDEDDSNAASNLVLQQYGSAKYTQLTSSGGEIKPLRVFTPKCDVAVYRTGATFAYGSLTDKAKWIDVAYPDVPHYSFKAALDPVSVAIGANLTIAPINIVVKYHMSFRTVR